MAFGNMRKPKTFKVNFLKKKFKKDFICFRERGREGGNLNVWLPFAHPLLGTWPAAQAGAPTGNRTSDSLVCRLALNPLSHTNQG